MKILVINGPNLNMLGKREPEIYGKDTLESIEKETTSWAQSNSVGLVWFQSNIEGEIVTRIQQACDESFDGIIINPGGYSHTSVAILDSLKLFPKPIIEVHISNTNKREEFRNVKITAQASTSVLEGFGKKGYILAIQSFL
ncbi:MAG: type II 3-dehydroquinate dehydratase [Halobacteriovorax sp.]|nr:type II 3-dehydroquinate dehydratase [Halobacteriovorax sp.]